VASHKGVVEAYIEGFRQVDHATILACLTDDVEWVIHGHRTLQGKAAFDGEIESGATVGGPTLVIDRMVEEGDIVVAVGHGDMTLRDGGPVPFVFTEVFTFDGDRMRRLETFHINLRGAA